MILFKSKWILLFVTASFTHLFSKIFICQNLFHIKYNHNLRSNGPLKNVKLLSVKGGGEVSRYIYFLFGPFPYLVDFC